MDQIVAVGPSEPGTPEPPKRHPSRWLDLQRLRSDIRKLALVAYATKANREVHQTEVSDLLARGETDSWFLYTCREVSRDVVKLNGLRRRLTELCALRAAHRHKRHAWDAAVRSSTIERYLAPGALPPAFLLPRVIPV